MNEWQERIGVGETHYGLGRTGPTRERRVIAEEGPRKGKTAAIQTDHADGRVDANVIAPPPPPGYVWSRSTRTLSLKETT